MLMPLVRIKVVLIFIVCYIQGIFYIYNGEPDVSTADASGELEAVGHEPTSCLPSRYTLVYKFRTWSSRLSIGA